MEFYVNNEKIDVQLENEKTVGDVLKSFELTCEQNNAAVIGININNKTITADIFDEESKKELSDDTKIEFTIVTIDTIKDSFESLAKLFDELCVFWEVFVFEDGSFEMVALASVLLSWAMYCPLLFEVRVIPSA